MSYLPWLTEQVKQLTPELVELRHQLHRHPEIGLDLPRTGALVQAQIESLDLEYLSGQDMTAFTAVLRGEQAPQDLACRPVVLLRGDMDGLPVEEALDLPWASKNQNMHACGHDLHTAGLAGAMRLLHAAKKDLAGDVVFMFQPGEEADGGALRMIQQGMLKVAGKLPDHAYAAHVMSAQMPAHTVGSRPGPLYASVSDLEITICGKGGHGSAPHQALDPIPVAAEIVTQAQLMVTREYDAFDPVIISCGSIQAGSAPNVLPEQAKLAFTIRTFSPDNQARVRPRLIELATHLAAAHRMRIEYRLIDGYPVTVNDPAEYAFARAVLSEHPQMKWMDFAQPFGAAEDFSEVLNRIPGCYVAISAADPETPLDQLEFNHSAHARFEDYAISNCATALASLALARLATKELA